MIAIVNNCDRFEELGQELKERWWKPGHHDNEATNKFELMLKTYQVCRPVYAVQAFKILPPPCRLEKRPSWAQDLLEESSGYLLDESFLDIDVHFSELLSSKWQNTTDAIDTVCATLEDYFDDYSYLKPKNFDKVITFAQVPR